MLHSLSLEIDGVPYEVTQFTTSFALNEIPQAQCLLAIGRLARGQADQKARIHKEAKNLLQMKKARVLFAPREEYRPDGTKWPGGQAVIFEGYFTGFAYRKISGKTHVIANLVHWLVDLAFSSALTNNGHVANPTQLNVAAVMEAPGRGGAGAGETIFISSLVPHAVLVTEIGTDLWKGIKQLFCGLANFDTHPTGPVGECGGNGQFFKNDRAIRALEKIEGPSADCGLAYDYGVPLVLDTAGLEGIIEEGVAQEIGGELIEAYAGSTFWDKLVVGFCRMFGMAVVPQAERALVIADIPSYRSAFWKQIGPNEYEAFDISAILDRPLRAVGVFNMYGSPTGASAPGKPEPITIGGCHVEDSVSAADGMIQYIAPEGWLAKIQSSLGYAADTSGVRSEQPSRTATNPVDPPKPRDPAQSTYGANLNKLYQRYAHMVYLANTLRGRHGTLSGILRFDVAPGSNLKILASTEKFIGGEDDLATTIHAQVARVTITINAEAGMAGTTFAMTHVRTEAENKVDRTSTLRHPLFKAGAIHGKGKHGAPLVKKFDL